MSSVITILDSALVAPSVGGTRVDKILSVGQSKVRINGLNVAVNSVKLLTVDTPANFSTGQTKFRINGKAVLVEGQTISQPGGAIIPITDVITLIKSLPSKIRIH